MTKAEWDAMWPYESRLEIASITPEVELEEIPRGDRRLSWTLPERNGGLSDVSFAKLPKMKTKKKKNIR